MKTVRDVMTADVVWVSPSARVKTAVILMKGHGIGALPVVHTDESVVGLVTYQSVLGEPPDAAVADVMQTDFVSVGPDVTVHDAAEAMSQAKVDYALVTDEGKLVGVISNADLVMELRNNFDPLTNMPWADSLRDWAMNALKRRMEISVIFFDLDDFGAFNKRYDHVIGDNVLKAVAEAFQKDIDPDLDFACRYGGDEFAVVSVRSADEAISLADVLRQDISRVKVEGMSDGVSGAYGMAGGRRTKERLDIHYAATIDDLITRASRDCTASKRPKAGESAPAAQPGLEMQPVQYGTIPTEARVPRLNIRTISVSTTGTEANVTVTLVRGGVEYRREASGYAITGESLLRLVADSTAGAVSKTLAPGHGVVVDEVSVFESGREEEVVSVAAVFISPKWTVRHVGCAVVRRGDRHRAAAAALLDAVNRQIEGAPLAEPDDPDGPLPSTDQPQE